METQELPTKRKSWKPFWAGLVSGMVAGGVVAVMMSPRSGAQTRAMARKQGRAIKEQAEDIAMQASTTAREAVTRQ
jgi:gas vesicle protein